MRECERKKRVMVIVFGSRRGESPGVDVIVMEQIRRIRNYSTSSKRLYPTEEFDSSGRMNPNSLRIDGSSLKWRIGVGSFIIILTDERVVDMVVVGIDASSSNGGVPPSDKTGKTAYHNNYEKPLGQATHSAQTHHQLRFTSPQNPSINSSNTSYSTLN